MKQKLLLLFALILTFCQTMLAQDRRVSGTVNSSDDGSVIPGVTVQVEGTTRGVTTDESGKFSILASTGEVLVFRSVGFTENKVKVGTSSVINVTLISELKELSEVVIIPYGTAKKSDFTGSAVSVGAKEIANRPISNALSALQGSGPGVQTTVPGGNPGSSPTIRIRGFASFSASNDALIVVDGVEYNNGMSNINPDDIESLTVLKDAATIAMYGSRGANGVVMVTTKRGAKGKSKLDFTVKVGSNANGVPSYNTVAPGQYYELMWEAYKNSLQYRTASPIPSDIAAQIASGLLPRNAAGNQVYSGGAYQDIVQYLGNYNAYNVANNQLVGVDGRLNANAQLKYADDLDWLKQSSKTGKRNEYNLAYSFGSDKTDMYVSLNYLDEGGWGLRSSMNRFGARINVNSQLKTWLKTGINFNGNFSKFNNASSSGGIVSPFYFARSIAPIYPVHVHDPSTGAFILDASGEKIYDLGNMVAEYGLSRPFNSGRHAIAENLWNRDKSTREFMGARAYVDIILAPWITFTTSINADLNNQRDEAYQNTIVGDGAPAGRFNQEWAKTLSFTFNQLVQLNKSFGRHNLSGTLGHEYVSYKYDQIYGMRQGEGFANFYTFTNFTDISSLSSDLQERAMESYFARGNYDYNNKYFVSASFRRDGDSRLPLANRRSSFWSVGLGWRLDQEKFFDLNWVDMLKIRASYGRLGNIKFADSNNSTSANYPYQMGYTVGYNNASAPGVVLGSLGSPDIRWEGQRPLDLGIDFSVYNGRLSGSIEWYNRVSDGLLFSVQQPYHNGGTTGGSYAIRRNVGDSKNTGWEISLTGQILKSKDFKWSVTGNVTTLKNLLTKMPAETPEIVNDPYKRVAGRSMYDYFTRDFYGVDPDNGRVLYRGVTTYSATNADIKIIENGSTRDTVTYNQNLARQDWVNKSTLPKVYGSLINNFSYKNFDFSFNIMYSVGGWVMDGQYSGFMSAGPSNGSTIHRDLLTGWRQAGDITNVPRMDLNQTAQFGATSTRWLTKADYLSLSAVSLGYRIPVNAARSIGISSARIFLSGENLYFISARKGLNTLSSITGAAGTDSYGFARTFTAGVNLSL